MSRDEKDLMSPKDLNANDLNLRLLREKQKKERYAKKCAELRKTELSKENTILKDVLRGVVGVLPRNSILQEKLK